MLLVCVGYVWFVLGFVWMVCCLLFDYVCFDVV